MRLAGAGKLLQLPPELLPSRNTSSSSQYLLRPPSSTMGGEIQLPSRMAPTKEYPKLAAGPVGKQIHKIYLDRLRQFTSGGQYESQGLLP